MMKPLVVAIVALTAWSACSSVDFSPPTRAERLRAIGPTEELAEALTRAFDPANAFEPIPAPGPNDWLANHPERGETFEQFVRSKPNLPDGSRDTLYLLPTGAFEEGKSPSTADLREYAQAFFAMDVKQLPTLDSSGYNLTTRVNQHTKKPQILTGDVLSLLGTKLPDDAFCLLAVTMEDLYAGPDWNFVFGQASLRNRVGVYSFIRYDPEFYGQARGADYETLLLRRSCAVLAHETGHMFGLAHCIYFHCLMNGANHLEESDAQPLHLCPVCLRKLHHSIGFDIVNRYQALHAFYKRVGFSDEATWMRRRLNRIEGDDGQK